MKKDSQTVRIKSTQTLAQRKGKLMLVTFEQRTRSGEWRERSREIYDNGHSATILPYDAKRKTVLLPGNYGCRYICRMGWRAQWKPAPASWTVRHPRHAS